VSSSEDDPNDVVHYAIAEATGGIPISWIVMATYLDDEGVEQIYGDSAEGQTLSSSLTLATLASSKYDERWRCLVRGD